MLVLLPLFRLPPCTPASSDQPRSWGPPGRAPLQAAPAHPLNQALGPRFRAALCAWLRDASPVLGQQRLLLHHRLSEMHQNLIDRLCQGQIGVVKPVAEPRCLSTQHLVKRSDRRSAAAGAHPGASTRGARAEAELAQVLRMVEPPARPSFCSPAPTPVWAISIFAGYSWQGDWTRLWATCSATSAAVWQAKSSTSTVSCFCRYEQQWLRLEYSNISN